MKNIKHYWYVIIGDRETGSRTSGRKKSLQHRSQRQMKTNELPPFQ